LSASADDGPQSVLHLGLGSLGLRLQQDLLERRGVATAAVVDPAFAGQDLADLVPGARPMRIRGALDELGDLDHVDAAIVTTSSDLRACAASFRWLLDRGIDVVSTCEELVYPWLQHRELAEDLDRRALANQARLLGTGVNPGFLMDALPVFVSGVCKEVRGVVVQRIQDAAQRRVTFQRKIGAGLDRPTFQRAIEAGWLRHVGLGESLHFIANYLGFELERWGETIEPVVTERELVCALGTIRPGYASGVRQIAQGSTGDGKVFRLEFQATVGQVDPHDRVAIYGEPPIDLVLRGGVHGDIATSAIVLNALAPLRAATPGLHTMATIPMVRYRLPPQVGRRWDSGAPRRGRQAT
jgi:2,4-diaminopentanoate dehydrogenase